MSTIFQGVLDASTQGVWRYASLYSLDVRAEHRVDLGDGLAPVRKVIWDDGEALELWREDLNPNGSHKDRSLAVQVSAYRQDGQRQLVISSSGNAAIAAAAACRVAGLRLWVFVSPSTPANKLSAIRRYGAMIIQSARAMGLANEWSRHLEAPNLRPSIDDRALEGYRALAFRFVESGCRADSVFCYTTSGSTLVGMAGGFEVLRGRLGWGDAGPQLHAAQAGLSCAVARAFGDRPEEGAAQRSIIGDLGAKRGRRFGPLVRALKASGGRGWAVSDAEILAAHSGLLDRGVHCGLESAAAVAAALRAVRAGAVRAPAVLLTGHYGHELDGRLPGESDPLTADDIDAVREALARGADPR